MCSQVSFRKAALVVLGSFIIYNLYYQSASKMVVVRICVPEKSQSKFRIAFSLQLSVCFSEIADLSLEVTFFFFFFLIYCTSANPAKQSLRGLTVA